MAQVEVQTSTARGYRDFHPVGKLVGLIAPSPAEAQAAKGR